jgi:DnaJ-domain-containing protein 1
MPRPQWRGDDKVPRPSPNEKRKIEARRRANERLRNTEAERKKLADVRVQQTISNALDHPRARDTLPDMHDLIERLWSAYDLAMATNQATSAINAVMAVGKLTGLLIDRSAVAVAGAVSVGIGSRKEPQTIEEIVEDLRENIGDRTAQRFIEMLRGMGMYDNNGDDAEVIEARRLGNGDANGAADG